MEAHAHRQPGDVTVGPDWSSHAVTPLDVKDMPS